MIYKEQFAYLTLGGFESKHMKIARGVRQGCPLSLTLFNLIIKTLAIAIRRKPGISGIQVNEQEIKLSLYAEGLTVYFRYQQHSLAQILDLIGRFGDISG